MVPSPSDADAARLIVAGAVNVAPAAGDVMLTVGGTLEGGGAAPPSGVVSFAVYGNGIRRRCLFEASRQSPLQSSRNRCARSSDATAAPGSHSVATRSSGA